MYRKIGNYLNRDSFNMKSKIKKTKVKRKIKKSKMKKTKVKRKIKKSKMKKTKVKRKIKKSKMRKTKVKRKIKKSKIKKTKVKRKIKKSKKNKKFNGGMFKRFERLFRKPGKKRSVETVAAAPVSDVKTLPRAKPSTAASRPQFQWNNNYKNSIIVTIPGVPETIITTNDIMSYLSLDGKTRRYIIINGFIHTPPHPPSGIRYYLYRYSNSEHGWVWDGARNTYGGIPKPKVINVSDYNKFINLKKENLSLSDLEKKYNEAHASVHQLKIKAAASTPPEFKWNNKNSIKVIIHGVETIITINDIMSYLSSDGITRKYICIRGFSKEKTNPTGILFRVYRYDTKQDKWLWDGNGKNEFGLIQDYEISTSIYNTFINLKKEHIPLTKLMLEKEYNNAHAMVRQLKKKAAAA